MPARVSHLLDSLVSAIDEGFSPDGIGLVPEVGLEDIANRPGLAGLLDRAVDAYDAITGAVSARSSSLMAKVFRRSQLHTPRTPNPRDSGISAIAGAKDEPREDAKGTQPEVQPPSSRAQERMPRKSKPDIRGSSGDPALHGHDGHGGEEPVQGPLDPVEKLPRKIEQNIRDSLVDPVLPGHWSDPVRDPLGSGALERLPRQSRQNLQYSLADPTLPEHGNVGLVQDPLDPTALQRSPRINRRNLRDSLTDPVLPRRGGEEPTQDPLGPGALSRSPRQSRRDLGPSPLGATRGSPAPATVDEEPAQTPPRRGNTPPEERLPRKSR